MLLKIDIKRLIKQSKTIQKMQQKTIEKYKVMTEKEFVKLYMKHLNKEVKLELSRLN